MGFEEFIKTTEIAISELMSVERREIILIHHDDADGLSSGAVIKASLERESYNVRALCLEKIYPEVVESLHKNMTGGVIFYADIGSAHADLISEYNASRNLAIILDHHDPKSSRDPRVHDLNLEHHGFQGETDFSGATCSYLFSKILNEGNIDLSYLALVGSCEIPGDYISLNQVVLDEATRNGVVKVEGKKIEIVKLGIRVDKLFAKLQILGAVGYYDNGPELGVHASLEGITEKVKCKIDEWEEKRKSVNKQLLGRLYRERLKETQHLQWFDAGDLYKGMGTKVVGQFCSFISYQTRLTKPNKYILGFVDVSPEVPGWGKLRGSLSKVSVRAPKNLRMLIDGGRMPGAVDLLLRASEGFGIADGHKYAANVVIPSDKKDLLLKRANEAAGM